MFGLGPMELMIVGIIALLLFGQRLPEVMRSLGKGMVEFKKGMNDIQDEIRQATSPYETGRSVAHRPTGQDEEPLAAPKFEPPLAASVDAPLAESQVAGSDGPQANQADSPSAESPSAGSAPSAS